VWVTADDLHEQLDALQRAIDASELLLRVECHNLETVYAELDGTGVRIHDHGETFAYRDQAPETNALKINDARAVCDAHDVRVDDSDPELYPRIGVPIEGDQDVQAAIDRVADAIEALLEAD
jgi:hypothetical protein